MISTCKGPMRDLGVEPMTDPSGTRCSKLVKSKIAASTRNAQNYMDPDHLKAPCGGSFYVFVDGTLGSGFQVRRVSVSVAWLPQCSTCCLHLHMLRFFKATLHIETNWNKRLMQRLFLRTIQNSLSSRAT